MKLAHPNKAGILFGVQYSPDGQRIIAGDYPGGVVQLWDAATGKQLTTIETGRGYRRSTEYFFLTPDWKTVYVAQEKRKVTRIEKDEKRLYRWEFDGGVHAWDLSTGKLSDTYQHDPPRGIILMELAPDGSTFMTCEELPGEGERSPKRAASLWDVKSKQCRPLTADPGTYPSAYGVYSPDGKTLAVELYDETSHTTTAVKLIDVATVREKLSIPITEKNALLGFKTFTPDGRMLIAQVRNYKTHQHWIKTWDAATGRELASYEGEPKDYFIWWSFLPDGKTLAVTNASRSEKSKLVLFDVRSGKVVKTVVLGERAVLSIPAVSPDGKWVAVITQVIPEDSRGFSVEPENAPQARIHLIDVAAGEVRETLIAPTGFVRSVCFSPDGKTLATGSSGQVLLWDLTRPPGVK